MDQVRAVLKSLQEQYFFNYDIIHYPEKLFCQIKIQNLVLEDTSLDLSDLMFSESIDFNLEFENSKLERSLVSLPVNINLVEFIGSHITASQLIMTKKLDTSNLNHNHGFVSHAPIIGLHQSYMDSLSTFDTINVEFIVQCVESTLDKLHFNTSLPKNLSILGVSNCKISELGVIRTNRMLQLLSIEIKDTDDSMFIIELCSPQLIKVRIRGSSYKNLDGSIKFVENTPELYFLDLLDFNLLLSYDLNPLLIDLFSQLRYLKLPRGVVVDTKMAAFLRFLNIPLYSDTL